MAMAVSIRPCPGPSEMEYTVQIGDRQIFTTVTESDIDAQMWVREVRKLHRKHRGRLVVGLRLYRHLNYAKRGLDDNPFSIIVLCVGASCLIYKFGFCMAYDRFHIHKVLIDFLRDPKIAFVGVDIVRDSKKLKKDCPVFCVDNVMELQPIVEKKLLKVDKKMLKGDLKGCGLEELASALLGLRFLDVPKPQLMVGSSQWDYLDMDENQLKRACFEAFLAFEIGSKVLD
ncbi:uncharacterized protein LOC131225989 [Magnolia sinica]|uniref:uncharacterized protein LOC131225989 n=1 Tax=Magnolia sinica TaxID=86752 RepID=UPI00265A6008|nr:uncharacterized protein LOC131225989 [Magnolia sinica]